jgi:hypothetical protein
MNRSEIENAVLKEIHMLPLRKSLEVLNFILALKKKPTKKRMLGLLKEKLEFSIAEDFKFTDDEFLQS